MVSVVLALGISTLNVKIYYRAIQKSPPKAGFFVPVLPAGRVNLGVQVLRRPDKGNC
jgi:hypothetical protein